ncbi:hypothetical protein NCS52_00007100 [Fusarium sp. LHS14.1]|nr:hypothetical protein NCS52_00007100 [Fusarium sp. LHS14.1]
MKRLGYRKSRKGCARCKQRRVKCDEKVPCTACWKHRVPCSLQSMTTDVPARRREQLTIRQKNQHHSSSNSSPSERPSGLFSYFSHFCPDYSVHRGPDVPLWTSEIELIHHYTANAHHTLYTPYSHAFTTLQSDVPQEALSHPFLLHQILAFSALHLAYLRGDGRHRYLIQASQHQGIAISTINAMLRKPIEPDSCHALYASSLFVAISAFGTFPSCDRYNDEFRPIESLVDIFVLMHGMHTILRSSDEIIRNGPLKTLLSGCSCEPPKRPTCLARLAPRLHELLSFVKDQMPTVDDEERRVLVEAIAAFIESIARVTGMPSMTPTPEMRVIFGWPMKLSTSYLALLREENPLALAILSYYCVLLQSREPNQWMFTGWSDALMKLIVDRAKGSTGEEVIQWPIDAIKEQKAKSVPTE